MRWFDRPFSFEFPVETYPGILERLRGTPLRLEALVDELPDDRQRGRIDGAWSVLEHVGHLSDLEPLWTGRIDDFLAGSDRLRPADVTNQKTEDADHDRATATDLLASFRRLRAEHVARLDALSPGDFAREARHPRLDQTMRLIDSCFFVAEHDDHHLAILRTLARA